MFGPHRQTTPHNTHLEVLAAEINRHERRLHTRAAGHQREHNHSQHEAAHRALWPRACGSTLPAAALRVRLLLICLLPLRLLVAAGACAVRGCCVRERARLAVPPRHVPRGAGRFTRRRLGGAGCFVADTG
jgi:hypothetical protein